MLQEKVGQRYKYWSTGIHTIEKHALLGVGMNRLRLDAGIGYEGSSAHNHLIHTAAELGIPTIWVNRQGESSDARPARTLTGLAELADALDELVPA